MAGTEDLVDALCAQTGLYLGTTRDSRENASPQAARIVVGALPGGSGVTFDYEGLNLVTNEARPFGHAEHALLARTSKGLTLYSAHIHAGQLAELRETAPGTFSAVDGTSPFPLEIRIEVPKTDRLTYTWSFRGPGGGDAVQIIGEVRRVR